MPHILIAGATGAGKSSCLNSLLTSILMRSTPDQVRMILVDPKRVEMGQYNRPARTCSPRWSPTRRRRPTRWPGRCKEMERRYDLLSEVGFRDITGYNAAFDRGDLRGRARPAASSAPADGRAPPSGCRSSSSWSTSSPT
jgi:DNA segregation ATPase FtsK/SpoIIIE, S-DNA-T family